jgi:Fe-S-cluster containining protein
VSDLTLPIKTLPIFERWDCAGCAQCCRGSLVPLDDDDMQRLRNQQWDKHPEYQGVPTVNRQGIFRPRYHLAQRDDGSCVFLTDQGRCRIHQDFGFDAKPLVCRMYPLQLVPVNQTAWLTLRRSCPTAAADRGRECWSIATRFGGTARRQRWQKLRAPAIRRGTRAQQDAVGDRRPRTLIDRRRYLWYAGSYGLRFCGLHQCRLKLDGRQLAEPGETAGRRRPRVSELFRQPHRPSRLCCSPDDR